MHAVTHAQQSLTPTHISPAHTHTSTHTWSPAHTQACRSCTSQAQVYILQGQVSAYHGTSHQVGHRLADCGESFVWVGRGPKQQATPCCPCEAPLQPHFFPCGPSPSCWLQSSAPYCSSRAWGNLYGSQGLPSEALWSRWQVKCGQKWAELPQPMCLNSLQGLQFLTLSPERTVKETPGHSSGFFALSSLCIQTLYLTPVGFYRQASFYFGK